MLPPPPGPTFFPYTTLFRSRSRSRGLARRSPRTLARGAAGGARGGGRRAGRPSLGPQGEGGVDPPGQPTRSEEHTSELQSLTNLVCRLLLEKKKKNKDRKQR